MGNPIKKLAGQTAIYGLSSIIGRFLNYLLTPLWTGVYSAEQFGIITEMYAYVAFLVVFLTYGMETAFFRFSSKKDINTSHTFSTVLISVLTTSAIFIGVCTLFSQPIANWLMYPNNKEFIVWFAIIVGVDAVASIPQAKLRQQNRSLFFAGVNLLNVLVNIGLNWFFIVYCKNAYDAGESNFWVNTFYSPEIGVGYVFIANLVASLSKFVALIPVCFSDKWVFEKALFKKMLPYALPLLLVGLAGIVNETLDRILLKRILVGKIGLKQAMEQVGIYGANYKLSILITLFIQAFRYAAEPFFFAQEKNTDAHLVYAKVMHYFIIVVSAMFLFVLLYLDVLKYFINNEELWVGLKVVPILLLANICLGVYYNLSIWYKLSEKTNYGAAISIFGAVLTIVLNVLLIPFFGYMGSAWATLICYASMVVVSYYFGQKNYRIPYNVKKASLYLGLALGFYALSILIGKIEPLSFSLQMLISTALFMFFIGIAYWLEKNKILT